MPYGSNEAFFCAPLFSVSEEMQQIDCMMHYKLHDT